MSCLFFVLFLAIYLNFEIGLDRLISYLIENENGQVSSSLLRVASPKLTKMGIDLCNEKDTYL
jgi:hypothetical protein